MYHSFDFFDFLMFVGVFVCFHAFRQPFYPPFRRFWYIMSNSREIDFCFTLHYYLNREWHHNLEFERMTTTYTNQRIQRLHGWNHPLHYWAFSTLPSAVSWEPLYEMRASKFTKFSMQDKRLPSDEKRKPNTPQLWRYPKDQVPWRKKMKKSNRQISAEQM